MPTIRIATRNSPLALWQAEYVQRRLVSVHEGLDVQIVGMTTRGDQMLDRSLATSGGKGLFLKELQVSLMNGDTDIAVHSMKDVPVETPQGLVIPVLCEREDPRDAFVSNHYSSLADLPKGARIGTSSLRRISQLKNRFSHCEFIQLRGNVNTRLAKLDAGEYDAIILAAAGLIRLNLKDRIQEAIAEEVCLPAVGQGIVGIECRVDDELTQSLISPLHDPNSALVLTAERAMNQRLEGGCQVPIAGFAQLEDDRLRMRGLVAACDGSQILRHELFGDQQDIGVAERLGYQLAEELINQGAQDLLANSTSG